MHRSGQVLMLVRVFKPPVAMQVGRRTTAVIGPRVGRDRLSWFYPWF